MNEIKYSILVPYYNRLSFHNTLLSWDQFYRDRKDWEVILVVDSKCDAPHLQQLDKDLIQFSHLPIRRFDRENDSGYTGVVLFNFAAKEAQGDYFVLTNPECLHTVDILSGFDFYFSSCSRCYVMCSVLNIADPGILQNLSFVPVSPVMVGPSVWLQHSVHYPRCLHFCSCIPRDIWFEVGGMDENYNRGVGYDDDDFLYAVRDHLKVPVFQDDKLLAYHQDHSRSHHSAEATYLNRDYYKAKWGLK